MIHQPRSDLTRQERRITLFTSGVWLIFLSWTVFGLIESTAALPAQVAGWAALVTFPVVYLSSFLYPTPLTGLNRHLNTLVYTAVLVLLGVLMSLATAPAIINIVPYLMAVWIFNHRLPTACIALVILFCSGVVLVNTMGFDDYATWFLAAVGSPAVLMLFIRISMHLGETQQYHAEQLTLARQREELASTVHDVLGHSLTTITVKIQLAQRLLATDLSAAETELEDIESLARRSLSEVRSTVTDLQHPDLAEQLDQADNALTAAGLDFNRPQPPPRLTLVQQQIFAWVLREAVTNIIRHAQASSCTISFHDVDSQTMLRIDDDGVGIPSTQCKKPHGLYGLQRRVGSAGGTLKLHHLTPGTRLEVTL